MLQLNDAHKKLAFFVDNNLKASFESTDQLMNQLIESTDSTDQLIEPIN